MTRKSISSTFNVNTIEDGVAWQLVPSVTSVVYHPSTGVYSPQTVTCSYLKSQSDSIVESEGGVIKVLIDGSTTEVAYRQQGFTAGTDFMYGIEFVLYVDNTMVDRKSVGVVTDGVDGEPAWHAELDNEMDSIACSDAGNPLTQQTVMALPKLFRGSSLVGSYSVSGVSLNGSPMTYNSGNGTYTKDGRTAGYSAGMFYVTYATTAVLSKSDSFVVTLTSSGVSRTAEMIVIPRSGDRYEVIPSLSVISVRKNGNGDYPTVSLTCGARVTRVDGSVTAIDNATGSFGGMSVYYRLRTRSSQAWGTWTKYATSVNMNTNTYDSIEFIIYQSTASTLNSIDSQYLLDKETVPVVADGSSAPNYEVLWYAWSNVATTASINTSPFTEPYNGWSEGVVPSNTNNLSYLWRKSVRYTYDASSNSYTAGVAQYVRMTGTNGTSIVMKGTVVIVAKNDDNLPLDQPYPDESLGIVTVPRSGHSASSKMRLFYEDGAPQGGAIWDESDGPVASDGDAYVVDRDCTYEGENVKGHLFMYSSEAGTWIDLGQFQGQSGKTYYTHIAWATGVVFSSSELPIPAGQTSRPNATSVTGGSPSPSTDGSKPYMGVLVDETVADSTEYTKYTWSYVKGDSSYFADIDNEMDSVACYSDGKVSSAQGVSTNVAMYKGSTKLTLTGIVVKDDNASGTAYTSGSARDGITVTWDVATGAISVAFSVAATITVKHTFYIGVTADGVTRDLYFTVNGLKSTATYNLIPSVSQIGVKRTDTGGFDPSTVSLTCGYKKSDGSTVTTDLDPVRQFDGYFIVFRRHERGGAWDANYIVYAFAGDTEQGSKNLLASLSVVVYDAVEFYITPYVIGNIHYNGTYYYIANVGSYIDKETVPVVSDGTMSIAYEIEPNMSTISADGDGNVTAGAMIVSAYRYANGERSGNLLEAILDRTGLHVPSDYKAQYSIDGGALRDCSAWQETVGMTLAARYGIPQNVVRTAQSGITLYLYATGDTTRLLRMLPEVRVVKDGETGASVLNDTRYKSFPTSTATDSDYETWSTERTQITTTNRYRLVVEKTSTDNGSTWSAWSQPVIDAYLSQDGTSISIKGDALGVLAWGDANPTGTGTRGDVWLKNNKVDSTDTADYLMYDSVAPNTYAWVGKTASIGDGYLVDGYLWMKVNATATQYQQRWKSVGRIQGPAGERGKMGRFFYYAGEFNPSDNTHTFIVNDAQAPYFHYDDGTDDGFWVFNPTANGSYTMLQMGVPSGEAPNWEPMTSDFKYIITEAIFGDYAHFGGSIINGDYLISQYGYIRGYDDSKTDIGEEDVSQYMNIDENDIYGDVPMSDKAYAHILNETTLGKTIDYQDSGSDTIITNPTFDLEGGKYYTMELECRCEDGRANFVVTDGTTIIASGEVPRQNDMTNAYLTFLAPADYTGCYLRCDIPSGDETTAYFSEAYVAYAYFVPYFILDMRAGKLVANNIVARGELHADSMYYDSGLLRGNGKVINVNTESIITLAYNSANSIVRLPSPSASKGRVIEIHSGIQTGSSFTLTYQGATGTTYFKNACGSSSDYRLAGNGWTETYLKLWCDGSDWWVLKAEFTSLEDGRNYVCLATKD